MLLVLGKWAVEVIALMFTFLREAAAVRLHGTFQLVTRLFMTNYFALLKKTAGN
jgi:hypothetical protein